MSAQVLEKNFIQLVGLHSASQHAVTYPRNRSADFEDVRSVCWPTNKPYADLPVLAVWWPTYLWFLRSLTYHINSHNYILYELLFLAMVLLYCDLPWVQMILSVSLKVLLFNCRGKSCNAAFTYDRLGFVRFGLVWFC